MAKSAAPTTRVRDPEGTRRKILAAALQEFSAKGIDGAAGRRDRRPRPRQQAAPLLLLRLEGRAVPRGAARASRRAFADRRARRPHQPRPASRRSRTASPASGTGSGSSPGKRSSAPVADRSRPRRAARRSNSGWRRWRKPRPKGALPDDLDARHLVLVRARHRAVPARVPATHQTRHRPGADLTGVPRRPPRVPPAVGFAPRRRSEASTLPRRSGRPVRTGPVRMGKVEAAARCSIA